MRDVHVTVAAIVARDGPRHKEFLFVEESIGGRTVLNQPAGHWEAGETLLQAVVRETLEETGWDVEPTALLGVYEFEPPELGYGFLRFAYLARPLQHHAGRPLDPGIARALWLTPEELRGESARHRSPMVQRCVDDALAGRHHPLSLIGHL
jgi:8-oxo-dGTP pyrophosphatase MutT (NUDIX family)